MDLGDVLLPYQKTWLGDKSPVKVVEKSRRIGLTWAQALDDVLKASTSGREGMDVLYISFNQDMTREYIDTCAEWAKKLQVVAGKVNEDIFRDGDEREIKAFRIDFASGHKILALSNRPSNLRGKQGRRHHRRSGLCGRPAGIAQGRPRPAHVGRTGHYHFDA